MDTVIVDVKSFTSKHWSNSKAVLVFPPFNNFRRFLVHKVVEDLFSSDGLCTFSIGQDFSRRTVVCYKTLLDQIDVEEKDKSTLPLSKTMREEKSKSAVINKDITRTRTPTVNIYRPPAARIAESGPVTEEIKVKDSKRSRIRRPDQQVYVPRPKRVSYGEVNSTVPNSSLIKESAKKSNDSVKYIERRKSSNKYNVQDSCSEENFLNTSEMCSNSITDSDINETQTENLLHNDSVQSIEHLKYDLSVSSSLANDIVESVTLTTDIKKSEISVANKSQECKDEDLNNFSTVQEQSSNFDRNIDKISTVCDSDKENFTESYVNEEELEIIDVEKHLTDNTSIIANGKGNNKSYQSDIANCSSSSEQDVLDTVDLNISLKISQTIEISETENCSEKQKNVIVENCSSEERNLKNRRILHCTPITDVLIISDTIKDEMVEEVNTKESVKTIESNMKDNQSNNVKVKASVDVSKYKNKISKSTETTIPINREECDWDTMFTDDGECLVPGLVEELTKSVGCVKVTNAESDYRSYQTPDERCTDGECIIEIYDFPAEFKTHDLLTVFSAYRNRSFHIKWVDDTHALGVFSSPLVADEVLASELPFVKTRPLRLGIAESRIKARNLILPPMERPKTCPALARRLVTGALGLRLPSASKEREAEKKVLKEAREKRRLEAKQREAIWEGTLT